MLHKSGNSGLKGYSVEVINVLAQHLNFTYRVKEPKTGTFGSQSKDGK